jgi:glyoxylase-like metal-dependent hydrolase (beta-lactamase superfamily II)
VEPAKVNDEDIPRLIVAPNPSPMTFRGTNTWIVGRGEVAVIDPGPADRNHLAAIVAALDPNEVVSHIFVTHAHIDHSDLARPLSRQTNAPIYAFGTAGDGLRPLPSGFLPENHRDGEGVDHGFVPDEFLRDGDTVHGANWQIESIHTPGHLGNHLCLAWNGHCFSGDHVMGWASSIVSPPEGHMGDYMKSLERLSARPWVRLYPGHGDPIDDPASRISELVAHRLSREEEIVAALACGPSTLSDLTTLIYTATPPALRPAASRNVLAHLLYLAERRLVEFRQHSGHPTTFHLC